MNLILLLNQFERQNLAQVTTQHQQNTNKKKTEHTSLSAAQPLELD